MQTKKEAIMNIYKGIMPEFIPSAESAMQGVVFPGDRYFGEGDKGDDAWGVNWTKLGPDPGIDGSTVSRDFHMFDDMDEWKDYVKFPDLEAMHVREILRAMAAGWDRENHMTYCLFLSGTFERMNQLVGMENALCAFYEFPDEVKEFFEAFLEYRLKCIDIVYEELHPDMIYMQDDWGTNNNMFFSPDLWREFIKPIEKKLCDHIHELGMLYEHHSCGYIMQIIPDLVELGLDALNPLNVCNDVEQIKREFGDKLTLDGGADNQKLDVQGITEEEIRAEARRVMDAYAYGGRYIPSYTYNTHEGKRIFLDEVDKYGKDIYTK